MSEGSRPAQKLLVRKSNSMVVLHEHEIEWIEADDYYAAIHARGDLASSSRITLFFER